MAIQQLFACLLWAKHPKAHHKAWHTAKSSASCHRVTDSSLLRGDKGFQGSTSGKEPGCQGRRCKRWGFNPWVRKIPWRRAYSLQYFCLENPMDRGAWWAMVHRVAKSWTHCSVLACMHILQKYRTTRNQHKTVIQIHFLKSENQDDKVVKLF